MSSRSSTGTSPHGCTASIAACSTACLARRSMRATSRNPASRCWSPDCGTGASRNCRAPACATAYETSWRCWKMMAATSTRGPDVRGGAVDGVSAVQARISEIQSRFLYRSTATSGDWASAAASAGLNSTSATDSGYGSATGSASETAVVAEAQKYIGVPYLWGGTDPSKGLDCSGFTQLVFGNLGVDLPRVSSQQATAGRPVASVADARPGDLVFFDYASDRPGIDHVGIYIGNGKMIAA